METVASQEQGTQAWEHEGYRYRRDTINQDLSMSLRCVRRDCAGRIKKLLDLTTVIVTPHNHASDITENDASWIKMETDEPYLTVSEQDQHDGINQDVSKSSRAVGVIRRSHAPCCRAVASRQGQEAWLHEGYRYRRDRINQGGSMSLRCVRHGCTGRIKKHVDGTVDIVTPHSHTPWIVASKRQKEAHYKLIWLHEGYRYRRDKRNQDGSMSLRCVKRYCTGRMKKLVDGTADYVTPHSHAPGGIVSQQGEQHERFHFQNDQIKRDVSKSLPGVGVARHRRASYARAVSQQGKEAWLHEGYRYRCYRINRDGSMLLRCVRRGCAGRLKKFDDGTVGCVTAHSHAPGNIVSQLAEVAWLHEGYHYRRDTINQDGSISLQCVRHGCAGRIEKLLDLTTIYVAPHNHASDVTENETEWMKMDIPVCNCVARTSDGH